MSTKTFTYDMSTGDETTADADMIFRIYGATAGYTKGVDQLATTGVHGTTGVSVTSSVATLTDWEIGSETKFKISQIDEAGNESALSAEYDTSGANWDSAVWAISSRKIVSTYSGSAMEVRRSSDNAVLDIGFDGSGNLDTAAIATHCSGVNGFISKWYNQGSTGSAYDQAQATITSQYKIYDSVSGVTTDGDSSRPAATGDANNKMENSGGGLSALNSGSSFSIFLVGSQSTGAGSADYMAIEFTNVVARFGMYIDTAATKFSAEISNGTSTVRPLDSVQRSKDTTLLKEIFCDGTDMTPYDNGTVGTPQTIPAGGYTSNKVRMTQNYSGSLELVGFINEIIIMPTDLEASRSTYESDINTYYTIY